MDFLVIEDDENKKEQIIAHLTKRYASANIECAASLMSGVREATQKHYDVIVLDMTLPNYDLKDGETGGGMHAFGGVEFLRQLKRRNVNTRVIVLTQFETFGDLPQMKDLPQLDNELRQAFDVLYLGAVYYHASIETWSQELDELIDQNMKGSERT